MASNAAAPPPSLSEAICETANDGSSTVVSTSTTSMPASAAASSGACMAVTSVGAIRMASGFDATTESTIGFCRVGSNSCGPCTLDRGPELLRLGLHAALHRDVELVAGDALHERDRVLVVAAVASVVLGSTARGQRCDREYDDRPDGHGAGHLP